MNPAGIRGGSLTFGVHIGFTRATRSKIADILDTVQYHVALDDVIR